MSSHSNEDMQRTDRSYSSTSTTSSGWLELTTPNHHRKDSSASSNSCAFLELTPSTPRLPNSVSACIARDAEESQRLFLLRARDN